MEGLKYDGWKLIRHRIPDVARATDGTRMETRPTDGDEHVWYLKRKLEEEAAEVADAKADTFVAEMADLRQALNDFCVVAGIDFDRLRAPEPNGALPPKADLPALFRERITRLVALADDVPDEGFDAVERVNDLLAVLASITHMAGIRDLVRAEVKRKLEEKGDFAHGVLWKKPQAAQ